MEILNLNLIPNGTNPVVHCSQYDEGRVFRFNLFNGSAVYVLDGTETIECDVKKPDGNIVTVAVPNTSDSYIDVTSTLQMCACSGNSLGTIKITKGGTELYTLNFLLSCERSPLENGIQSDSAIHNLETQIADAVADQYDSNNVIFDNTGTAGHGIGYTVTSEGILTMVNGAIALIPTDLNDLSDVNITSPTQGEALVFDADGNIVNGTVSTVGNLDDLNDVDTTGKAEGDSLRYIGNEWKAKPTTVEMTKAVYDAISDFTPYKNTHIVITDAPNLNPTASDIEYSSGVSVADELDDLSTIKDISAQATVQTGFALKSWGSVTVKQIGKLVYVVINGLYSSSNISTATNAIELPKVSNGYGVFNGSDDDRNTVLMTMSNNSNMMKIDTVSANKNIFASFVYLTI